MSILIRKAQNFARRPRFEKAWFVPVWLLLGISRFAILFVPFRQLVPWLGMHDGVVPWVPLVEPVCEARALAIAKVIRLAGCYTPWTSNCFPQAVTARVLLGFYGIPYGLFFGVARAPTEAGLTAHAWVATGRVRVTGGEGFGQFAVVGCFVSRCLAAAEAQSQ